MTDLTVLRRLKRSPAEFPVYRYEGTVVKSARSVSKIGEVQFDIKEGTTLPITGGKWYGAGNDQQFFQAEICCNPGRPADL